MEERKKQKQRLSESTGAMQSLEIQSPGEVVSGRPGHNAWEESRNEVHNPYFSGYKELGKKGRQKRARIQEDNEQNGPNENY